MGSEKEVNIEINSLEELNRTLQQCRESSQDELRSFVKLFDTLYEIDEDSSHLILEGEMRNKMTQWLGNKEELLKTSEHQVITLIRNKVTHQNALYNPLRALRPSSSDRNPDLFEEQIKLSASSCDFCENKYKHCTAEDSFGRLESTHSYTASNVFKFGAWHSMSVLRSHHPCTWTMTQVDDMFDLAAKWFSQVHSISPQHTHPVILWDSLPSSGSSQIHPHIHMLLSRRTYPGLPQTWHQLTTTYETNLQVANCIVRNSGNNFKSKYWSDFVEVHHKLGLAVKYKEVWIVASLTPVRNHEVILLAETHSINVTHLIYAVLRMFIDDFRQPAFSLAMTLPPMGTSSHPVVVRAVPRGSGFDPRSDTCSLELFLASNISSDPYLTISLLQNSIEKRLTAK